MNKKERDRKRARKIRDFQKQCAKENLARKAKHAQWLLEQIEKQKKEIALSSDQKESESPRPTIISTISPPLNTPGLALFIRSLEEMAEIIDPEIMKNSNVVFEEGTLESILEILESVQRKKTDQ